MNRQGNTPVEQEIPSPTGIVSVNARGARASSLAGKVALALIILGIMIIGALLGLNRYRAAQSAEERARLQAEKDGKATTSSRHRRIFGAAGPLSPLPAMGNREPCPNGTAAQLVLGPDGSVILDAGGLPKQQCQAIESASAALGTAGGDPLFNEPSPAISNTGTATHSAPAPRNRFGGDIVIPRSPGQNGLQDAVASSVGSAEGSTGSTRQALQGRTARGGSAGEAAPHTVRAAVKAVPDAQGPIGNLLDGARPGTITATTIGNRDMILPQGRSIDCNLTVRLVNEVSGMATCILSSNVYSDNGRVVLAERGSTAVGEYVAMMAQGQRRLFVLWTRLQTPKGVIIDLNSPGTDALGTSGLPGHIGNRWPERIGAAVLLSLVEDAIEYKTATARNGEVEGPRGIAVLQNSTQTGRSLAERILDSTINIKPTLYKNQGDRASIFVSRDLDFGSVYVLRAE